MSRLTVHGFSPRPQRGFTLLEVLIAVIVLSLGLLGLAKLQTVGLTANNIAYQRSQATILAYEAMDMVYADRENAHKNCYNKDFKDETSTCNVAESPGPTLVKQWKERLEDSLPGAEGDIRVSQAGTDRLVEVEVQWRRWTKKDGWDSSEPPRSVKVVSGI